MPCSSAIFRFRPARVVALGDSFQDRGGPDRIGTDDLGKLQALQADRDWIWVAGNHDPEIGARAGVQQVAGEGAEAQGQLREVAGADHEAALLVGEVHQDLRPLAGLQILVGSARAVGRVQADRKNFMEAKSFYERLVEITPDDPIAWYNLAGVYVDLDNPQVSDYNTMDTAIQCYLRVLELDPKHLEASFKLMDIALIHKKTDLAIKVMESAVEHNPDEPLAYYNLISVYDKCKMFEQAEQARQRLKERFAKKTKEHQTT